MFTFNSIAGSDRKATSRARGLAAAALAAALLAGCGGDSSGSSGAGTPPGPAAQTISDVVAYVNGLIAGGSDSAEPVDVNPLTLATDDVAQAAPVE